jgi:rubrerythrin
MIINTCSGAISSARDLEDKSAKFYEDLAQRFPENKDLFLSFVKENNDYITQVERAYYGVITDAIEGCFAFNLDLEKYALATGMGENTSYTEALNRALKMEETIIVFYLDAADQSKSLMADVPRAFRFVAKKRSNRQARLKSMVEKQG